MTVYYILSGRKGRAYPTTRSENPGSLWCLSPPADQNNLGDFGERIEESGKPENTDLHVDTHRKKNKTI